VPSFHFQDVALLLGFPSLQPSVFPPLLVLASSSFPLLISHLPTDTKHRCTAPFPTTAHK
jgi:hypothetical protein